MTTAASIRLLLVTATFAVAAPACVNLRIQFGDGAADETGTTGTTGTTGATGTTGTTSDSGAQSDDGGADGSTGGGVADGGGLQACVDCLEDNCPDEYDACVEDDGCACLVDCVVAGGALATCPSECGVAGLSPVLIDIGTCLSGSCVEPCVP